MIIPSRPTPLSCGLPNQIGERFAADIMALEALTRADRLYTRRALSDAAAPKVARCRGVGVGDDHRLRDRGVVGGLEKHRDE